MNRIYIFWFNDGGYECGDTCMTIIAKNKKRSIEMAKEEYGKYAYDMYFPTVTLIGYTPLKEQIY